MEPKHGLVKTNQNLIRSFPDWMPETMAILVSERIQNDKPVDMSVAKRTVEVNETYLQKCNHRSLIDLHNDQVDHPTIQSIDIYRGREVLIKMIGLCIRYVMTLTKTKQTFDPDMLVITTDYLVNRYPYITIPMFKLCMIEMVEKEMFERFDANKVINSVKDIYERSLSISETRNRFKHEEETKNYVPCPKEISEAIQRGLNNMTKNKVKKMVLDGPIITLKQYVERTGNCPALANCDIFGSALFVWQTLEANGADVPFHVVFNIESKKYFNRPEMK